VAERPRDAQGHNVLGGVLQKVGDLEGAIQEFRQAIRLDLRLTEAHVNLGQALAKAGRKDEALATLAEVQRRKEQEAGRARAMVLVGAAAQLGQGEVEAAVGALREAVAAAPDFAEGHYELGLALARADPSSGEAEEALLRAVQLDPGRAEYRFEWARRLRARGDTEGARGQLRMAVERRPSLAPAQRELGALALRARDWATAAGALQAALSWGPADAAAYRDLATALDGLGRGEEAARARTEARRLEAVEARR
jgi:tetratricopeptide (TPR) repeat protein